MLKRNQVFSSCLFSTIHKNTRKSTYAVSEQGLKKFFFSSKFSFSPTAPTPPPPIWTLFETAKSRPIVCLPSFRALWSQISWKKLSWNWKRTTFWYVNCARKICAQNISQQFFKEAIWQIIIKKKIFWQSKEELLLLQGVK